MLGTDENQQISNINNNKNSDADDNDECDDLF